MILEGDVQICRQTPRGRRLILENIRPGMIFGEQSLATGSPRKVSARADTPVVALRIPAEMVGAALAFNGRLRQGLVDIGAERLRAQRARESALLQTMALDGGPARAARERVLSDGAVLFREGDEAHHSYVVLSGRVALYKSRDGRPMLIRHLAEGGMVGELALARHAPREATVVAEGPVRLYEIDADYFSELQRS